MFESTDTSTTSFAARIVHETGSKIRSFLYELAEGTSNYQFRKDVQDELLKESHGPRGKQKMSGRQ